MSYAWEHFMKANLQIECLAKGEKSLGIWSCADKSKKMHLFGLRKAYKNECKGISNEENVTLVRLDTRALVKSADREGEDGGRSRDQNKTFNVIYKRWMIQVKFSQRITFGDVNAVEFDQTDENLLNTVQ